MAQVTPASIDIDSSKLRSSIRRCVRSIRKYTEAIKDKRIEQEGLRRLVDNPGEYNVVALKRNVEMCDKHVEQFEITIKSERKSMNHYTQILEVLEEKKRCLSETILV